MVSGRHVPLLWLGAFGTSTSLTIQSRFPDSIDGNKLSEHNVHQRKADGNGKTA
jgi:hypothetical protein